MIELMKGNSKLFNRVSTKMLFTLDLQLFAGKRVSDVGVEIQNSVENQKLKNLIGELYREGTTIGDGSAMAAASEEIKTGILIGGRNRVTKIEERIKNLENILRTQNLTEKDKSFAKELLIKMKKSLKGEY